MEKQEIDMCKESARRSGRAGGCGLPGMVGLALVGFFFSCMREQVVDPGYNYYPLEEGHWVLWRVDSFKYSYELVGGNVVVQVDTVSVYVRMKVGEKFTDLEGRPASKLYLYTLDTATMNEKAVRVWYAVRDAGRLEVMEENLRFIKLVFPPLPHKSWKGNALLSPQDIAGSSPYNYLWGWEYYYERVDEPLTVPGTGIQVDSGAVVVEQILNTVISVDSFIEWYGRGVGPIYKVAVHLERDSASEPFKRGFRVFWRVVDWRH